MNLQDVIVARVEGKDLSLHELLHALKRTGRLRMLLSDALVDKVVSNQIEAEAITVTDEELQTAGNAFRQNLSLNKVADTERWLASNRMSPRDLEVGLERNLARHKLLEKVTRDQVAKYFEDNRRLFDRARLAHVLVEKEGAAQEILSQVRDDGLDFGEAARRHSVHEPSKHRGGAMGLVPRRRLNPAVETAVFAAKAGDVVGPFALNNHFQIVKVEEIRPGELNAPTTAAIQNRLFRTWIRDRLRNGTVQVHLFDYL